MMVLSVCNSNKWNITHKQFIGELPEELQVERMISVSRAFHAWCGLIPSQGIPHGVSLPISIVDVQMLVSNHIYQTLIERYKLNLKDKDYLRQQVESAILAWKESWFTTGGREGRENRSFEEEIITDVTSTLILGTSGSNNPQTHSLDHLNEEYIVTAMLLVSQVYPCYHSTYLENRWLRLCRPLQIKVSPFLLFL